MAIWLDGQPGSGDSSNINSGRVSSLAKGCGRPKTRMSSRKLKNHVPGGCHCSSSPYVCSHGPCNQAVGEITPQGSCSSPARPGRLLPYACAGAASASKRLSCVNDHRDHIDTYAFCHRTPYGSSRRAPPVVM